VKWLRPKRLASREEFMAVMDYPVEQGLLTMKKYCESFIADYRFSP
jgi:hypothetical protein